MKKDDGNANVVAYYIKEIVDKRTFRHIPVNCPKRLLDIVQKQGQDKYKDNYVSVPTTKKAIVENEKTSIKKEDGSTEINNDHNQSETNHQSLE
jgi:catalase